jgi:hypothetical protein
MPSFSSSQKINSPPENNFQFEKLLAAPVTDGVDFETVGGLAVTMNGCIRVTEDMDIIVSDSPENLRKLLQSPEKWGKGFARELTVWDCYHEALDIFQSMNVARFSKVFGHWRCALRNPESSNRKMF